ncbi:MAG: bifunctional riboflavin kinase/FAD synthetase [Xenococcaceae cyanobacterium]
MWIISSSDKILKPTAVALGNFDGIHRGHQQVLQPISSRSSNNSYSINMDAAHIYRTVVSFSPHPREFFTGKPLKLLTPIEEKVQFLEQLGIEQLVLLPFDRQLAALNPQQFVEEILVKQLQATRISIGSDFHFGYQRAGTSQDLQAIASGFGIEVCIVSLKKNECNEEVRISSSLIRQALKLGEIERANQMLGRAYSLSGKVVTGQQLGRKIGFPTANLQVPENKFLPRFGVYYVSVAISNLDTTEDRSFIPAVMNIGCRPTVEGDAPTIEIHLLDWSGDLYDRNLTVYLEQFIRPEQKFPSLDALKAQIARDCETAKNKFKVRNDLFGSATQSELVNYRY